MFILRFMNESHGKGRKMRAARIGKRKNIMGQWLGKERRARRGKLRRAEEGKDVGTGKGREVLRKG